MSISTITFTRPSVTFQNTLLTPVFSDADADGTPTIRMLVIASLTTSILLDVLGKEYSQGRDGTDDQASIYRSLETKLNGLYGLDGRGCVLRFICELQKFPIRDWTIIGELITAIFTPRDDGRKLLQEYREAQWVGQEEEEDSCFEHYAASCPLSVYHYFNPEENDPKLPNNLI